MGDIAGGVIGGAIAAVLATALSYGVVEITNWQIGIIAVAVGFIVGQGVVFGAGRHPSIALVPISVAFTLVALVVSEYLIARHFLGIAAAEISAEFGVTIAEVEAEFASPIELLRFSLESEPIALLFWAITGWEAFIIPMRAATRSERLTGSARAAALPFRGTPPLFPPKRTNRRKLRAPTSSAVRWMSRP